jgi:excisionase family DNA binding protein
VGLSNVADNSSNMLTASELASLLNVHINTVRRWSNSGLLQVYRIGPRGDRRFLRDDVDNFLAMNLHSLPATAPLKSV